MKRLFIAALIVLVSGMAFAGEGRVDVKFNRVYKTSEGWVYFDHGAHSLRMSKQCSYCHNVIKAYGGYISAKQITANGYWTGTPSTKPAAHFVCRDCHTQQNLTPPNAAPTACSGCHGNTKL